MVEYKETEIIARLEVLPRQHRTVFALACAERLHRYFKSLDSPGSRDLLRRARERLIHAASGVVVPEEELQALAKECETTLYPDDDAVAAVIYAYRAWFTGQAQEAAWAARRAYEARDRVVSELVGADFNMPGTEEAVLRHPLVQTELERQLADLNALASSPKESVQTLNAVLARARDVAETPKAG